MLFTDNTHEMDESQSSISLSAFPEKKKRNFPPKLPQEMTNLWMANLWMTLTNQMSHGASNTNNFPKQDRFTFEDKA